ncbi:MAG: multidrug efflux SMR transporter [Thermomicrobiales bacterium]|nr:multidrug efflux SMR transporter [Thermomicrobiales bacterium]
MSRWMLLGAAIFCEVAATLSLAAMDGFAHPCWLLVVVPGYLAAFALISRVLAEGMPIGVAYGIWAAAGVALTAMLAAVLFGDPLTWVMGLGIILIMGGVLLVETGSHEHGGARRTTGAPGR